MDLTTLIAVAPLGAMVLGAGIGFGFGRWLAPRAGLWLLGAVLLVSLGLLFKLVLIEPGGEMAAFAPFVTLTGGVFPALFGGVLGWLLGRALEKRAG